jgi:hypothetical protein
MKIQKFIFKGCLISLLFVIFSIYFSIENKGKATNADLEESDRKLGFMSLSEENVIEEIENGRFDDRKDYFGKLSSLDLQEDSFTLSYAYQLLGEHYIYKDDVENTARAYSLSLNKNPFNFELTKYLQKLGVRDFSEQSIKKGLESICKK